MMTTLRIAAFAALTALAAGCGGEYVDASQSGESLDGLQAVTCNPRDGSGCDPNESCLTIATGARGAKELSVCSASRCTGPRDCRAGYTCRLSHCIALERSAPDVKEPARAPELKPVDRVARYTRERPVEVKDPARTPVR